MRRREIMTAGGVTLAGLGVLVGLAIGSGEQRTKSPLPVAQPVEVRTQIIRKTVNVYRRDHPHRLAGTGGGGSPGSPSRGLIGPTPVAARTRTSSARALAPVASPTPVLRARSSGSKVTRPSAAGGPAPVTVTTRSSGAGARSGAPRSAHPVKTRASGGGDGGDGNHGHND